MRNAINLIHLLLMLNTYPVHARLRFHSRTFGCSYDPDHSWLSVAVCLSCVKVHKQLVQSFKVAFDQTLRQLVLLIIRKKISFLVIRKTYYTTQVREMHALCRDTCVRD